MKNLAIFISVFLLVLLFHVVFHPLGCFLSGSAVADGSHRSKIFLPQSRATVSETVMPRLASSSKNLMS
ncbi:hypothetical protein, partial [Mesorhizobium sp. M7A.F.Ca.CA.004.11.2.1]|uniref:hypothetical protein n=1 Tax=Mesorhizobium sp. M7A.F.Ca.CA.004.11.2.1 TaxID=2496699 RepID=UPI0019CFF493